MLRPRMTQAVAVDVAGVPLLARLDGLMAASAVNDARSHEGSKCSPLGGAPRCIAAIWSPPLTRFVLAS